MTLVARILFTVAFVLPHLLFGQALYRRVSTDFNATGIFRNDLFSKDQFLSTDTIGFSFAPLANVHLSSGNNSSISLGAAGHFKSEKLEAEIYLGARSINDYSYRKLSEGSTTNPLITIPGYGITDKPSNSILPFIGGQLKYQVNKYFDATLGYGNLFFGDGYHSLLSDDNGAAMPYLRLNASFWKANYSVVYAIQSPINPVDISSKSPASFSTIHALDIQPWKWIKFQLFEGIVWLGKDSVNNRGFDIYYLNPMIFYRPVEYSLGSNDNAIIGGGITLYPTKNIALYGQLAVDEFLVAEVKARNGWWANKQGWQLGAKWKNAFGLEGLFAQGELNTIRPYTYAHASYRTSYTNNGISRAHFLGSNFTELYGILSYSFKEWIIRCDAQYLMKGVDNTETENYGGNPLKPQSSYESAYGNKVGQGNKINAVLAKANIYRSILKKKYVDLYGFVGVSVQQFDNETNLGAEIGIRTQFPNFGFLAQ